MRNVIARLQAGIPSCLSIIRLIAPLHRCLTAIIERDRNWINVHYVDNSFVLFLPLSAGHEAAAVSVRA